MPNPKVMGSIVILVGILLLAFTPTDRISSATRGNTTIQSFNKAKRILQRHIYSDRCITFYCGCEFTPDRKISYRNGYRPKRDNNRANRIEWEHIVPAHAFGQSFKEWRDGHP
jgi:deoxyribonuclease-1